MTKNLRLSNSAKDKYIQCSEKYRLHYIEKLRSPRITSSLFFGNALDDAFSRLLLDKKKEKTEAELAQLSFTAEEVFYKGMLETKNDAKQVVKIPKSHLCDYYSSDFDEGLLSDKNLKLISEMDDSLQTVSEVVDFHEKCREIIKKRKKLAQGDLELYNSITWLTLVDKGYLLVDAYRQQIMPEIEEVFSIQKEINLPSEQGDVIAGKIDFIASFNAEPGKKYICDNKSSSKAYKDDSVLESEQLSTYCEHEGIFNAAYVVIEKKIYKKEPKIHTQIIKSTISDDFVQKTFDNYENVCNNILAEKFEKNWSSCFAYGRICPYFALCKHNNSDHLINCKEDSEETKKE